MTNVAGQFGDYVKSVKTGAFVKVRSYDPKNEVLEIESNGVVSTVPRNEVERTTPDDELKIERLRNPNLPPTAQ